MQEVFEKLTSQQAKDFADEIGKLYTKAPHLPKKITQLLIQYAPFFVAVGVVFSILSILSIPFLFLFLHRVNSQPFHPLFVLLMTINVLLTLTHVVLLLQAYRPLRKRSSKGWMFLFWSDIVSIAQVIFMIIFAGGRFSGMIGIFLGLYFLYEIRQGYTE